MCFSGFKNTSKGQLAAEVSKKNLLLLLKIFIDKKKFFFVHVIYTLHLQYARSI
jgi:hypothetical protein